MITFAFLSKIFWEGGGDLRMIFCQSVSVALVVSKVIGGEDTGTLVVIVKFM